MPQPSHEMQERKLTNLYSETEIRQVLGEYLSEFLPLEGYIEDVSASNVRIVLAAAACLLAVASHFLVPFPQQRLTLGACVIVYFALNTLVLIVDSCFYKGSMMILKNEKGQKVYLDGDMARFDEHITFRLRSGYRSRHATAGGGKGKITPDESVVGKVCFEAGTQEVWRTRSCGHYFDSEGHVVHKNVYEDVMELVDKYEQIKKGKPGKKGD
ncbi:unnamed protein product [Vitrella brassicaformis CCMP3155]|uniref:Signal peptidase complex subunit 2 n=2 Tax=Vitrella brassicaformis TaxID=1169539 RepID=A0A0G4F163_VITBC|nr:unnamed protein product [Vitrella brassicaformis CCMP3155]|eukprot:CEM05269.1 unnamed protein product [Vitrella brassicaformis CCMP3155]